MTETGWVRLVVLGLVQERVRTDLFEIYRVKNWKQDLSNDTTFNPQFLWIGLVESLPVHAEVPSIAEALSEGLGKAGQVVEDIVELNLSLLGHPSSLKSRTGHLIYLESLNREDSIPVVNQ